MLSQTVVLKEGSVEMISLSLTVGLIGRIIGIVEMCFCNGRSYNINQFFYLHEKDFFRHHSVS